MILWYYYDEADTLDYNYSFHDEASLDSIIGTLCLFLNDTDLPDRCNASDEDNSQPVAYVPKDLDYGQDAGEDMFYRKMGLSLANQKTLPVLYCLIMATALLGNSLVLMTVGCKKSLWKPMYIFIISLAVSDIVLW